jgi:protein-S-isoprenylcysteine O-methyltransferase Ste14
MRAAVGHCLEELRVTRNHWLEGRIPPPVVGALVAASMWGVSALGPQFGRGAAIQYAAVALLVAAGLTFDLLGILAFRGARTTINPLKPERASALVTHGVYRVTRNPMYVGMGLLLLAWAVYLGALLPMTGPIVFVAYITRFQIRPEERVLLGLFGETYRAYAARVRRWL